MQHQEPITSAPVDEAPNWAAEVGALLMQAATMCVEHGLEVDMFIQGAWTAYVDARPGMREYIEEMTIRKQLQELRDTGQLGEA